MKEPTKIQRELILRSPSSIRASLASSGVIGEELENSVVMNIEAHKEAAKEYGLEAEMAEILSINGWLY